MRNIALTPYSLDPTAARSTISRPVWASVRSFKSLFVLNDNARNMHADKVMVYMRWRETGKPEPNSKNTVTLNSAEGDVSEAGGQVPRCGRRRKQETRGQRCPSMLSH